MHTRNTHRKTNWTVEWQANSIKTQTKHRNALILRNFSLLTKQNIQNVPHLENPSCCFVEKDNLCFVVVLPVWWKSANTSEQYRQFTQFTNYIIVICIIFLSGQNIYPLLWTRSLYNIFIIKILYNICITFFLALTYLPYLSSAFFEHEICANQLH